MNGDNSTPQGSTTVEPEILTPDRLPVPTVTSTSEIEALAGRYAAEAQEDLTMAQAVVVDSDQKYEEAGGLRLAIDKKRAGGEGVVETLCGPLYKTWKTWRALFMRPVELRQQASKILSDKRLIYQRLKEQEAERIRRDKERQAQEEQDRLSKLAEQRAQRAEARGDTDRAEEIRATVPQVTAPVVPVGPVVPQVKGIAKVTYWHADLVGVSEAERKTSLLQLVTAVAAGEVPLDAVTANLPWLNKTAGALKQAMKYPGVRVWSEQKERGTGR